MTDLNSEWISASINLRDQLKAINEAVLRMERQRTREVYLTYQQVVYLHHHGLLNESGLVGDRFTNIIMSDKSLQYLKDQAHGQS